MRSVFWIALGATLMLVLLLGLGSINPSLEQQTQSTQDPIASDMQTLLGWMARTCYGGAVHVYLSRRKDADFTWQCSAGKRDDNVYGFETVQTNTIIWGNGGPPH